jgi:hypothetical protein
LTANRSSSAQGDTLCIPRGAVHSLVAKNDDVAFMGIATAGVFGRSFFEDLAPVVNGKPGGPPSRDAIADVMSRHGLTPALPAGT